MEAKNSTDFIWIFHGAHSKFASGVFTDVKLAAEWINKHNLTGLLSKYPVNKGVYDWAIENGLFEVKKQSQKEPLFIQSFSTASQDHFHYEDGEIDY